LRGERRHGTSSGEYRVTRRLGWRSWRARGGL
jgi:hypothetical protein